MINSHHSIPFPLSTSIRQPKIILDDILTTIPSNNVQTPNIPTASSCIASEFEGKQIIFQDFMAKFGSILSVLETFMIDDSGSPKNKPSPFKLIDSIASEVTERHSRKCNIIVKNVPRDWDLDSLMNHFWYLCSLTGKVLKLKRLRSKTPLPLVMITFDNICSAQSILASSSLIHDYFRNLNSSINVQVCEDLTPLQRSLRRKSSVTTSTSYHCPSSDLSNSAGIIPVPSSPPTSYPNVSLAPTLTSITIPSTTAFSSNYPSSVIPQSPVSVPTFNLTPPPKRPRVYFSPSPTPSNCPIPISKSPLTLCNSLLGSRPVPTCTTQYSNSTIQKSSFLNSKTKSLTQGTNCYLPLHKYYPFNLEDFPRIPGFHPRQLLQFSLSSVNPGLPTYPNFPPPPSAFPVYNVSAQHHAPYGYSNQLFHPPAQSFRFLPYQPCFC